MGGRRRRHPHQAGQKLTIDIVYYTFRPDLVTMAPIQASFVALGIQARFGSTTTATSWRASPNSGFDMLLWAQHTLPAGDPKWFLDTFFRSAPPPAPLEEFAQIHSTHRHCPRRSHNHQRHRLDRRGEYCDRPSSRYPVTFLSVLSGMSGSTSGSDL